MRAASVHDFATIVRGRRRDLGLTQGALAARVGVSRKWLSEFERGATAPDLGLVVKTLDALGLEISIVDPAARPAGPPSPTVVDLDAIVAAHRRDG